MENFNTQYKQPSIIGTSESINRIREMIPLVADYGLNILICGETGVGKDIVAQRLYYASPRAGNPFIKVIKNYLNKQWMRVKTY